MKNKKKNDRKSLEFVVPFVPSDALKLSAVYRNRRVGTCRPAVMAQQVYERTMQMQNITRTRSYHQLSWSETHNLRSENRRLLYIYVLLYKTTRCNNSRYRRTVNSVRKTREKLHTRTHLSSSHQYVCML